MIYILHGADDYSISRELEVIKNNCGDPSVMATNTTVLDGADISPAELRVACETVPFLADKRLVIINGLFEKFTARQSRQGTKKNEADTLETFAAVLNSIPPFSVVILLENELKDTNPLFKLVGGNAIVKSFPQLKGEALRTWVDNRVAEEKGDISPAAAALMVRLVGGNLWVMSSEISKLLTFTDGHKVEEKDVKALVSYAQEFSVFNLIDAIVDNNLSKAENILEQLLRSGESPSGLIAMFTRQMRLIVRAKDLKSQKLQENEIRSRLGISQDFVMRKTLEQAGRYTPLRLKQVYQQLLEADVAIKTGLYEPELALNILVAELCQIPAH